MINVSKLYCGLAGTSDRLRYQSNSRAPVVVYNCTTKCNLKCLHCYSYNQSDTNRLSTIEAKQLLKQLADYNCPVVLFSGGEPLLHPNIFELLTESVHLNLRTVLSTNGTLINSETAKHLADIGINYVGISIDGAEKTHDKFRNAPGSFAAAMKGFENCKKAGLKTGLRFTITPYNYSEIEAVFDIAAKTEIRRICFYHLIHTGRAENITASLSDTQTRQAMDTILKRTRLAVSKNSVDEVLTVGNHADGPYILLKLLAERNPLAVLCEKLLRDNGGNKVGQKIAAISADGNVYPDQFWQNYSLGNIKEKPFAQIWSSDNNPVLKMLRDKKTFADKRCKKCKWFELCRGNFRFNGNDYKIENWHLEPPCYLTDLETGD